MKTKKQITAHDATSYLQEWRNAMSETYKQFVCQRKRDKRFYAGGLRMFTKYPLEARRFGQLKTATENCAKNEIVREIEIKVTLKNLPWREKINE